MARYIGDDGTRHVLGICRAVRLGIHRSYGAVDRGEELEVATLDLLTKVANQPVSHIRELLAGGGTISHRGANLVWLANFHSETVSGGSGRRRYRCPAPVCVIRSAPS